MSLLNAAERFASIDRSQILLDPKQCLHTQDSHSACAACFEICPVDAITAGKPPSLASDVCQSCMACLPVCPVGAYHADDDVAALLNCVTHVEGKTIELLCGVHPHPDQGVETEAIGIRTRGCLAGLGVGAYLTLSALGMERILARTDACRACKWHSLDSQISPQTAQANRFLSAWGRAETVTCVGEISTPVERPLWDAHNPPLSRRDLFRMMSKQGQVAMARAMEDGVGAPHRQPGRDRMRLLAAVLHLPKPSNSICLEDFDFALVVVSEACTACGACARACPTEALRFEKNDSEMQFSLIFSAKACIGCDICDHVCLPDAIGIDHAPSFEMIFSTNEPIIVASGQLARCERCKTLMAAREGVKLCPLCQYRRTNPFGSMLPQKIIKETRS